MSDQEDFEFRLRLEQEQGQEYSQQPKTLSAMDKLGSAMRSASQVAGNTPMGMIAQIPNVVNEGASKLGEYAATSLAEKGMSPSLFAGKPAPVSPILAAGVGTGIAMAPDIIQSAATPIQESGEAVDAAKPFARRALGFKKPFLKTPFARGQADRAATIALENNVIPPGGSPETMLDNATNLANKSGYKIGQALEKTPADLNKAFDSLEEVRGQLTNGLGAGIYEKANKAVDEIQQNILELSNKGDGLTAADLNAVKARLGQSLNYLSDLASQGDNKAIQTGLANAIRDMVKSHISPEEFTAYLQNQKLYGAAKLMQKGLNNEISRQMGNEAISLPSVGMAAGELATGSPVKAAMTAGGSELFRRRGAGMAARGIQDVATNWSGATPLLARPTTNTSISSMNLDEISARKLLDEAKQDPRVKNGEISAKDLARQFAKERGYK